MKPGERRRGPRPERRVGAEQPQVTTEQKAVTVPQIVMYEQGGALHLTIKPIPTDDQRPYGALICDLVRRISRDLKVGESAIWEWIDEIRRNPGEVEEIKQVD